MHTHNAAQLSMQRLHRSFWKWFQSSAVQLCFFISGCWSFDSTLCHLHLILYFLFQLVVTVSPSICALWSFWNPFSTCCHFYCLCLTLSVSLQELMVWQTAQAYRATVSDTLDGLERKKHSDGFKETTSYLFDCLYYEGWLLMGY